MIYSEVIQSKNGSSVPLFLNGKPMHSRYDPQKEAKQFASSILSSIGQKDFFVVLGFGGAYHLQELLELFPNAKLLVVEENGKTIDYLCKNILAAAEICKNPRVAICEIKNFAEKLKQNYLPAIHSTLGFIEHKTWCTENPQLKEICLEIFNSSIKAISSDFSVQAHFGKLWTQNILKNLKFHNNDINVKFPLEKIALIVAAGPSLEKKIEYIKANGKKFYVIATDTAYKILVRHKIPVDAVFSVDGQLVSINHFMKKQDNLPLFIFELTANNSCTKSLKKKGAEIIFTYSGHPLELLAVNYSPSSFLYANSNSGTVTIAALDFALHAGFKNIQIVAADFSFDFGKSYSSGSYLDDIYQKKQKKTENFESLYSKLMYRTPLIKNPEGKDTTGVLESYRIAFDQWILQNNADFIKKDGIYFVTSKANCNLNQISLKKFDSTAFFQELRTKINIMLAKNQSFPERTPLEIALLPLISHFKFNDFSKPQLKPFNEYLKLALSFVLRYT